MERTHCRNLFIATVLWLGLGVAQAAPVVVDFDSFVDSDRLTTQVPGLVFSNTEVLEAGVSLNEIAFPPRSGTKVVSDLGGAITISFAAAMSSVGAYFTYGTRLVFSAYDADANLLGSDVSAFLRNEAVSGELGSVPNEFLGFAGSEIRRVVIAGDLLGASFTMDDLTFESAVSVPEPASLALALVGLAALLRRGRRR